MEMNLELTLLENKCKLLAESFTNLTGSLTSHLHALSGITVQYLEVYRASIIDVSNELEDAIDGMNKFIKNCEDLDVDLDRVVPLAAEIKELRRKVDLLDKMIKEK